ncbi:disulfide bond formation protein B [Pontibacterium granulatum]|uniref:disulfide bond formation protein B n=1 Tax=Pontibacterium granulatum TaxID=2036029 RepID=UPI002499B88E|nr:disulfide bond formation protein B [Pontibacterium granulatum]MDI3325672.1 disulfide bond formation protein B [Pontibacterium granulatum]
MGVAAQGKSTSFYWSLVLVLGIAMEAIALYFQYGLDYGPCVLCIHIRIYVLGFILLALLALTTQGSKPMRVLTGLTGVGLAAGMAERSWKTFGVERGFIEGACDMDSGLPDWFALDKWFPTVFEPWEPCGYTPELLFDITMAEGLLAVSAAAILGSLYVLATTLRR